MNRQSRALLAIFVVAAVLGPYWWLSNRADVPSSRATDPFGASALADPAPSRGGSVVASARSEPRTFNRLAQADASTDVFALLTLGKLVRINRVTQEIEPWLAQSWTVSADERTFTLTLRDGVSWSDGTPFTAADVLFSFQAIYDPRTKSPLASAMTVGGAPLQVTSPDPQTVVVTYPAVFGPGIRLLDNVTIMPKHKLQPSLDAGAFAAAWSASTPPSEFAAIGPFVLTDYQPARRLVYERNPRFWRRDDRGVQLPYLDRLTIELVGDQDSEVVRLQAGQIDFMQDAIRASDLATLLPLEQQGRVRVEELGVTPNADAFVFNLNPAHWAKDPRAAWLPRREFRRALSHAVDREAFADTVFLGAAVPIHGPVTPGNAQWFWPSIPRYEFSRDRAKTLLTELGLANRDEDEWLEDATGAEARLTVLVFRGNSILERSASVLRDDFRHVGVALDIVLLEPNAIRSRVVAGDFDAALINLITTDMDPAISKDFWLSNGSAHFWHFGQTTPATDWEREIDTLMTQQTASTDAAERKRIFNEVQRVFAENLPVLYFAAPRVYIAANARLINLQPGLTRPQLTWTADTLAVRDAASTR